MKRILAILGWAWTVALAFSYAAVGMAFPSSACPKWACLGTYGAFLVLLAGAAIFRFALVKAGRDKRGWLRGTLLFLLTLPLACLLVDAPPIADDYTEADVRTADPAVLASYDTLMKLLRADGLVVETALQKQRCEMEAIADPTAHAAVIRQSWDNLAGVRKVLEELDRFPGITGIGRDAPIACNTPVLSFMTIRATARTYSADAGLLAAEGNPQEAARRLSLIHRIARKSLPCSGTLVEKMVWIAVAGRNLRTASTILRSPHDDKAAMETLKENFRPLSMKEVSLRRPFIAQYLRSKELLLGSSPPLPEWVKGCGSPITIKGGVFEQPAMAVRQFFLFRKNRTLRDLRALYEILTEDVEAPPTSGNQYDAAVERYAADVGGSVLFSLKPRLGKPEGEPFFFSRLPGYNMTGKNAVCVMVPSFLQARTTAAKNKILSDLLWLELCQKLGETLPVMADPYTKKPYATDAKGRFFSAGPDGIAGTDDDIFLEDAATWPRTTSAMAGKKTPASNR